MIPAAPSPSDSSIAQAFRELSWERLSGVEFANAIETRAAEIDAATISAPAAAVGGAFRKPLPVPANMIQARAQGRSEALAIILGLEAETGLDDYIKSSPMGMDGEYSSFWDDAKLRELFRADDTTWSLLQDAEGEYWHNAGLRDEAEYLARVRNGTTTEADQWRVSPDQPTPAAPAGGFVVDKYAANSWDFNGCHGQAVKALRHLAKYGRCPDGGSEFPNMECCQQIADELERSFAAIQTASPAAQSSDSALDTVGTIEYVCQNVGLSQNGIRTIRELCAVLRAKLGGAAQPSAKDGVRVVETLPTWLLVLIGNYGFASANSTDVEKLHRWELLMDGIKAYRREATTAAGLVDDAMVERACKRYAFREDGAVWPDAYSPNEVAAERVLMREFLEHVVGNREAAIGREVSR